MFSFFIVVNCYSSCNEVYDRPPIDQSTKDALFGNCKRRDEDSRIIKLIMEYYLNLGVELSCYQVIDLLRCYYSDIEDGSDEDGSDGNKILNPEIRKVIQFIIHEDLGALNEFKNEENKQNILKFIKNLSPVTGSVRFCESNTGCIK